MTRAIRIATSSSGSPGAKLTTASSISRATSRAGRLAEAAEQRAQALLAEHAAVRGAARSRRRSRTRRGRRARACTSRSSNSRSREHAEQRPADADLLDAAAGRAHDDGRGMPGASDGERVAVLGRAEDRERRRAELLGRALGADRVVDDGEDAARRLLVAADDAHRLARQARERRGRRAVPGDVADREEVVLAGLPGVVEVAADLGALARRPVARDDLGAGRLRRACRAAGSAAGRARCRARRRRAARCRSRARRGARGPRRSPGPVPRSAARNPWSRASAPRRRAHGPRAARRWRSCTPRMRDIVTSSSSAVSCAASHAGTSWMSCERPVSSAADTPLEACLRTGRLACRRRASRAISGIGVRDAQRADLAVVEHVDRAPVGESRHRELDELRERVLQVERLGEHDAGLGQERERLLAPAVLGQVEEGGDGGDDLAAGVAHGLGAERDEAARAIRADHVDFDVGRRLASEREVDELGVRRRRSSAPTRPCRADPARAGS